MTQRETLRTLDAQIAGAFASAGLADVATYTPRAGTAIPDVPVLIDRSATLVGGDGQVLTNQIVVTAFHADIGEARPLSGSTFVLGDEIFTVDTVTAADESRVMLLCKVGR